MKTSRSTDPCCTIDDALPTDAGTNPLDGSGADAEFAAFAKAVSHPVRMRILRMLARKEARACSVIVDELPLAQSTVSETPAHSEAGGPRSRERERAARQLLHRAGGIEAIQGAARCDLAVQE